jgi:hypothetical protein
MWKSGANYQARRNGATDPTIAPSYTKPADRLSQQHPLPCRRHMLVLRWARPLQRATTRRSRSGGDAVTRFQNFLTSVLMGGLSASRRSAMPR